MSVEILSDDTLIELILLKLEGVRVSIDDSKSLEEFFGDEDFSDYRESLG
ncbi:XRE family transcriptional regulator [Streptococcus agalactiae LMG 14747]|uniref:XRE family transcriptional regulator n=1 Tax=Streptococcus agalactiae LMG 14747 TaxID=1154860 RepID=V6Z1J2_STRAG|nr:XRE family transcriptional regulator [Streptococcus agalactiae LMG 14747]